MNTDNQNTLCAERRESPQPIDITDRVKPYVGVAWRDGKESRVTFLSARDPGFNDKLPFDYCIGPFRTLRGARFMALYGSNNPHCQHVDDAERLAKS